MSNEFAIQARDVGVRFFIRHHTPTVHSGLVRFMKGKVKPDEFWALRHIDFDIPRGSVFGFIGANGSGKSTMLRTIARIYHPDEGSLKVRGKISNLISLGAGFQKTLSGMENITFNGMLLGLSRQEIERKKEAIIEFADIGKFIHAPVRTYSSGMRARLGFAIAVHVDPEILVVDEVLVVGDAQFRQKCSDKIRELFTNGATVVMVQHNMDVIVDMCQQVMWLDKGKARMLGDPETVANEYLASKGLPPLEPKAADAADPKAAGGAGPRDAGGAGPKDAGGDGNATEGDGPRVQAKRS
ncbi:MAG: ABC transporter ATP-binding protein [Actinomycetota bacterium]